MATKQRATRDRWRWFRRLTMAISFALAMLFLIAYVRSLYAADMMFLTYDVRPPRPATEPFVPYVRKGLSTVTIGYQNFPGYVRLIVSTTDYNSSYPAGYSAGPPLSWGSLHGSWGHRVLATGWLPYEDFGTILACTLRWPACTYTESSMSDDLFVELPTLPSAIVFAAAGVLAGWRSRIWKRRKRDAAGHCVSCNYSRAGLALDAPCPECGAAHQSA